MRTFFLLLIACLCVFTLTACEATQVKPSNPISYDPVFENRENLTSFAYNINTILNTINNGNLAAAQLQYNAIEKQSSISDEIALLAYTHARLLMAQNHFNEAYERLNNTIINEHISRSNTNTKVNIGLLNSEILSHQQLYSDALKNRIRIASLITNESLYLKNHQAIWDTLNNISIPAIKNAIHDNPKKDLHSWLKLNLIFRNSEIPADKKLEALDAWLAENPNHPASLQPPADISSLKIQATMPQEKIALILPFNGKYAALAEAIRDGFIRSYFEKESPGEIRFYNSEENVSFLQIYQQAVSDGATLIVGPLFKNQLEELITLDSLPVKTIALNKVLSEKTTTNLFQFSLAPEDEINALIEHINAAKFKNAFILAQNDDFSQKNKTIFTQLWKNLNNNIISEHTFSETTGLATELDKPLNIIKSKERANNLQNLLGITVENNPKSRTDIDLVILFTKPDNAAQINVLLDSYLPNEITKYSNSAIYRGFTDTENDQELNGIIFTDMPLILNTKDKISKKYRNSSLIRMYAFGIDAHQIGSELQSKSKIPLGFDGATGKIFLENNEFIRTPSFAIFTNGIAIPLAEAKPD